MKNSIKTFFIEAKKILFIPLIFCVFSLLVELLEIVFLKNNDHAENLKNMDKLSMIFLYAFFSLLFKEILIVSKPQLFTKFIISSSLS